jgi:hypothetical protein
MNRRGLLKGALAQAGTAATAVVLPSLPPSEDKRRTISVSVRKVVHRLVLDGQEVPVDGALARLLRPQQAQSAAKAMVVLADLLQQAAFRESALRAALGAYAATYGALPEARQAFIAVLGARMGDDDEPEC